MEIKDVLGIQPIGEAISTVTKGLVAGASAFLSRICLPAAEEYGFLLQDKVRAYRAANATQIAVKAERKLAEEEGSEHLHADPRLVGLILNHGSWIEADDIQEMWAGLLASSCSEDGHDDSNLMFVDLLSRLTTSQARLLDYTCRAGGAMITPAKLLVPSHGVVLNLEQLQQVCGVADVHRIDRELDHLRSLDLIYAEGGFNTESNPATADVTPTPLALQMFARLNGHIGNPLEFFGLTTAEQREPPSQGSVPRQRPTRRRQARRKRSTS